MKTERQIDCSMRCSKCGNKIGKNSSFCIKCGARVPPVPKKNKKVKKNRKRSKAKIVIPVFILLVLAILSFLLFGGDRVPEQIRNLKGYSYLTVMVKEKLPDKLPFYLPEKFPPDLSFKLPFDLSFKLPFEFPDLRNLLEKGKPPKKDNTAAGSKDNPAADSKDNPAADSKDNPAADSKDNPAADSQAAESPDMVSKGVDNQAIINDQAIYHDISPDWKHSNVKVLEHDTDLKAGTDKVVVYMELENSYVSMIGTKEITYQYNKQAENWEAVSVSKLSCQSLVPINQQ